MYSRFVGSAPRMSQLGVQHVCSNTLVPVLTPTLITPFSFVLKSKVRCEKPCLCGNVFRNRDRSVEKIPPWAAPTLIFGTAVPCNLSRSQRCDTVVCDRVRYHSHSPKVRKTRATRLPAMFFHKLYLCSVLQSARFNQEVV